MAPKLLPTMQTHHALLPITAMPPPPTTIRGVRLQTRQLQIRPPTAVLMTHPRQGKISMQPRRLRMAIRLPHPQPLHKHPNSPVMQPKHQRRSAGNQKHRHGAVRMCQTMTRERRAHRDGTILGILKLLIGAMLPVRDRVVCICKR